MNGKPLIQLGIILTLALTAYSCTEEELDRGRAAETHYVDLLYALEHQDQAAARLASNELSQDVSLLRVRWYRPLAEEEADNMYYHLDMAERVYTESRNSISEGNLELAAIQLDRAVYELSAADPVAFNELYVGSIYDFVATWLEVSRAVKDQELCSLAWTDFSRYGKDARHAWQQVKWRRPSEQVYPFTPGEITKFHLDHAAVDTAIERFIGVVKTGDQCAAQVAAVAVDDALWRLLLRFGSAEATDL